MRLDRVRIVVLAAGRSERMGFDKLVAPFAGVPLARRVALALRELSPLVVAAPPVAAVVGDIEGVEIVATAPTAGAAATLALANAAVGRDLALAVVPCDLPCIDAARVAAFVARVDEGLDLAWPVVAGVPGHPVVWSPRARARIALLRPNEAPLRLRRDPELRVAALEASDEAYVADVDTPADWDAVERQAARGARPDLAPHGYGGRMERNVDTEQQGDFKNALPSEVTDRPDSGMPRQLRTQADDLEPLSREEADVAGMGTTPSVVYGETDEDQNRDDRRDMNRGSA